MQEKKGLLLELLKSKDPRDFDNRDVEEIINIRFPKRLYLNKEEVTTLSELVRKKYNIKDPIFNVSIFTDEAAGRGIAGDSFVGFFSGTKDEIIDFLKHHIEKTYKLLGESAISMYEVSLLTAVKTWVETISFRSDERFKKFEDTKEILMYFLKTGPVINVNQADAICPICKKTTQGEELSSCWYSFRPTYLK